MERGTAFLDKTIQEGNADEVKTARYFKTNFTYQYIFTLGMKGNNDAAYPLVKSIEREMTSYTASDFPLRYVFFGKNFVIKWDDFAPTQAEYYTSYGEIAYNLSDYPAAIRFTKLALAHPNTGDWLKYVSINKLLDIHGKNNTLLSETEYIDYAAQAVIFYHNLNEEGKKTVVDYNYPTDKRGVNIVLDNALKNVPAALERVVSTAVAASQGVQFEKNLQLFDLAYRNKLPTDASFHTSAESFARKAFSTFPTKATILGIMATDRMAAALATSNCAGYSKIIENYTFWKETTKASTYTKKREECLANEEKARKKAERKAKRANGHFNLYAGAYILPLIKSNPTRDYGAVINFAGKKTAWEFSYLKININKENVQDLTLRDVDAKQSDISRWNGFYAHVQPKFMMSKGGGYVGLLMGYASKEFEPLTVNVSNPQTQTFSSETFNPTAKQYILMGNFGGMMLLRGFGLDLYYGIGATYSQWKLGNSLDNDANTIENIVLENRKDSYFGIIMRLGMTMGINFGRGNMR
jgi:hypothetical protein